MTRRVAIIGAGPLPIYQGQSSMGPGIRTWQLARPVSQAGHEVLLVTFEFAVGSEWDYSNPQYTTALTDFGSIQHVSLPEPALGEYEKRVASVQSALEEFNPDAVVSAGTFFAARIAGSLRTELPLWIDLFGHTMSEVQAKVARSDEDESDFFRFLYQCQIEVLRRGDIFSTLSNPQKYAAIGELSLAGRINDRTLAYDFVHVIPCGFDPQPPIEPGESVLRGKQVSEDDFVVLWTGGFNSWVDERTLFEGMIAAMEKDASIKWVGLGGGIKGHFQKGYEWFRHQAEQSPLKDRFVFLNWLPTEQVRKYFPESDIGINVDLPIYEALLGGRNRIVGWMADGLPTLTTEISEISRILSVEEIGFTVPVKRPDLLAKKLLQLSANRVDLPLVGQRAREYAHEHLTFKATSAPLVKWLEAPAPSPDRKARAEKGTEALNSLEACLNRLPILFTETPEEESQSRGLWHRIHQRIRGK